MSKKIFNNFLILCIFFFIGCQSSIEHKSYSFQLPQTDKNYCKITNTLEKPIEFELAINDTNFYKLENVLSNKTNIEKELFNLITQNTWHDKDIFPSKIQSNPYLLLNSLGGGACASKSIALSSLYNLYGLSSKVWGLNGHVTTEVFNTKWQVFDPDLKVFYLNKQGNIASYNELCFNDSLILFPFNKTINVPYDFFNPYSIELANYYHTTQNNTILNKEIIKLSSNKHFILPSKSSFTFPYYCPLNSLGYYYAKLKIPKGYVGKVSIPLLLHSIEGKGEIEYLSTTYNTDDFIIEKVIKDEIDFTILIKETIVG